MARISLPPFDRRGRIAWLVLVVCLIPALLVWYYMRSQEELVGRQQFELHVREIVGAIEKRMRQHEQILLGGAGLFDASDAITRSEWKNYVNRLRLAENYPGIQGVGFSQVIHPAEMPAHLAAVRAEGFPDYTVSPPGERALYTAIVFLEPFSGRNLKAFGYDMYSEATRRAAMTQAAESGQTAISGKVKLVQETHGKQQAGFLMYVPVYSKGARLDTPALRWQALQGFVYSPYRVDDLMQGILGEHGIGLDLTINDGAAVSDETLMYASAETRPLQSPTNPRFKARQQIRTYGHTWTISLNSRPEFEAKFQSNFEWLVLFLGCGVSLSLFALTWSLVSRRERALLLAQGMTEQIRSNEMALQESVSHTQAILDNLADGIATIDGLGAVTSFSRAAERIFGYAAEEVIGRNVNMLMPEPYHSAHDGYLSSYRTSGIPRIIGGGRELNGRRKDGSVFPMDLAVSEISQQGKPLFIGIVRDISERKQAEAERLSLTNLLNNVLVAASEFSIIATDTEGLITIFNVGAERQLGYKAEEIVGLQSPAILHLPEEVMARGKELSAEFGRPVEGFRVFVEKPERDGSEIREWTYRHKDGHHIPVSLVVTTMRDNSGQIVGYLGIAQDVTERKQAEMALRDQALHTRTILDNMVDGIITIDGNGSINSVNPAAERIFAYSAAEMMGQNVKMLVPSPHRENHDNYLRNYQATGVARIIGIGREVEGQRKDGSLFPMDLAISEITRQGSPMYVGMVRDITERKRAERMKSEFVSTVSHELRTPLTSISGALGLIVGGALGEISQQAREMIAIAYKNSQRLTHLINDLLDMEKIAAGKLHFEMLPQALMPLVTQAVEANRAYGAERRVSLALRGDAPDVEVRVDSQRFMQVLSNLLSNAVKFSPEDGVVEIAIESRAQMVKLSVIDHGPGIPANFRERIFQKFAQADSSDTRQKGGTGLGLAITKELVERMGGRVGFSSVEGEGASFFVELPVWNTQAPNPLISHAALPHDAPRILVVEDDPDVAQLLGLMLTRAGYAVDTAANGASALESIRQSRYAAVTLDLILPDISGLEIIRQLRSQPETFDLPIFVVSARMEEGRLSINGEFSGIDWLSKPIDQFRLLDVVERLLPVAGQARPRVLHVEDDVDMHRVIRAMIGERFDFELATTLHDARARIARERFDVVILDIGLPDGSGWSLLPEIRALQPDARVVVLSGSEMTADEARKVEAVLLKSQVSPRQLLDAISHRINLSATKGKVI